MEWECSRDRRQILEGSLGRKQQPPERWEGKLWEDTAKFNNQEKTDRQRQEIGVTGRRGEERRGESMASKRVEQPDDGNIIYYKRQR